MTQKLEHEWLGPLVSWVYDKTVEANQMIDCGRIDAAMELMGDIVSVVEPYTTHLDEILSHVFIPDSVAVN